ncbi:dehydrase and lipid transport-domain-containing protein [Amylocystis lapponica]|nr:dehydrase and lipid transport-domain-containing protein [Amylocystis lapponica]
MTRLLWLPRTCAGRVARRSIFTLPDLSSFSPFSDGRNQDPQTYHERKILPYKPSQLYSVVSDVTSYPQFIPFCTSARILGSSPSASSSSVPAVRPNNMQVEMTVGFLSFKESYISQVSCRPNESVEVVASSSTPLFKALNTVWRFQPASPQSPHSSSKPPLSVAPATPPPSSSAERETQADDGPTLVTLDLAFSFASPVHAAVSATFFGQVSKMMVKAFEERCLAIYGPGKK